MIKFYTPDLSLSALINWASLCSLETIHSLIRGRVEDGEKLSCRSTINEGVCCFSKIWDDSENPKDVQSCKYGFSALTLFSCIWTESEAFTL